MSASGTGGCRTGPSSGVGTVSCNPRKFSEKIALHTQRQAEETAAFQEVMLDITSTRIQAQKDRLAQNQGLCYGGSLPNVHQIGKSTTELQWVLPQGQFFPDRDITTRQTRHHGLVERVPRDRRMLFSSAPYRRRRDCSPHGANGLSSSPNFSWRRTNSDSALHASVSNANPGPRFASGSAANPGHGRSMFPYPVPPIEENMLDEEDMLSWDNKKSPVPTSRPKSCEVPGIRVLQCPSQPPGAPLVPTTLSSGGSLPDLTSLRFPPPLPPHQDELGYPSLSGGGSTGNLAATLTQLGITAGTSFHLPGLSSGLQGSFNSPVLQCSLSHPNIQSSLSCHSSHGSLSSASLQSSLSNPSLQCSLSSSPSLPSSLSSQSLHSSLSNSSLSGKSLQSAASSYSSSSGIGGSGSCSSSSSYSPLLTGQQVPSLNTSPRRRSQLSPLKLPAGTEVRWHHPKQFSPTMSPTLSSITQGVALDTSRLPVEQRPLSHPYCQPQLCSPGFQQSANVQQQQATQQQHLQQDPVQVLQQHQQLQHLLQGHPRVQQEHQQQPQLQSNQQPQPQLQSHILHQHGSQPQLQSHVLHQHGAQPQLQSHALQHHGSQPQLQSHALQQHGSQPQLQSHALQQHGSQPQLQSHALQQHGSQPRLQSHALQQHGAQPQLQSHALQQHGAQPRLQSHALQQHGAQPQLQSRLRQQHGSQPQLQSHAQQQHGAQPQMQSHALQQHGAQPQLQLHQHQQYQQEQQLTDLSHLGSRTHQQQQWQQQEHCQPDPLQFPQKQEHRQLDPLQFQQHQEQCQLDPLRFQQLDPQNQHQEQRQLDPLRFQQHQEQCQLDPLQFEQLDPQNQHQAEPQQLKREHKHSRCSLLTVHTGHAQSPEGLHGTGKLQEQSLTRDVLGRQLHSSLNHQGPTEEVPAEQVLMASQGPSDDFLLTSLLDEPFMSLPFIGRPGQLMGFHGDGPGGVQSSSQASNSNTGNAGTVLPGSCCSNVHQPIGQEKHNDAGSEGLQTKPGLLMTGSSDSRLSKDTSYTSPDVSAFEINPFSLDDSLQMGPLALEGLGLLDDGEEVVADPCVEDSFRSDRFL